MRERLIHFGIVATYVPALFIPCELAPEAMPYHDILHNLVCLVFKDDRTHHNY
jgi:hypothetical protein